MGLGKSTKKCCLEGEWPEWGPLEIYFDPSQAPLELKWIAE